MGALTKKVNVPFFLLAPALALAHAPSYPIRGALELGQEGVALMLILDVFAGPAAAQIRLSADRDGDGALSETERAAVADALAARALDGLTATLDGRPVTFAPGERKVEAQSWSARTDAALAASVFLRSAAGLARGLHELVLSRGAAGADPPLDLVVQGADGARVLSVQGARRSAIPGSGRAWRLAAAREATISFEVP